jgi:hypothetical protein
MRTLPVITLFALLTLTWASIALAESFDVNPQPFLDSADFRRMKSEYQQCVLQRGSQLLKAENFETAMTYAPLACRRDLLKIKRLMLGSAFKVEVANGLLASIAEGVEIDLVNALLEQEMGKSL